MPIINNSNNDKATTGLSIATKGKSPKQVIAFKTVADYKSFFEKPQNLDDLTTSKEYAPKDGITIKDLGAYSDDELVKLINRISKLDYKSNLLVMYANGCSFSWSELQLIAEFKHITAISNSRKATYYKPKNSNSAANKLFISERDAESKAYGSDSITLPLNPGKRESKDLFDFRVSISNRTKKSLDELLSTSIKLSNQDKSKLIDEFLKDAIKRASKIKQNGRFKIVIPAVAEQILN